MPFKDIVSLKHSYNSEKDDLLTSFYIPVLKEAISYKRITGYFSSSSFSTAAPGLAQFIKNDGRMQFILNVKLSLADYEQIEAGLQSPDELIASQFLDDLSALEDGVMINHARVLGWLIAHKRLEIRIGYIADKRSGDELLHQKVGILRDSVGNQISFSGSNNESAYGWKYNSEKFKVFMSWQEGHQDYINEDIQDFEELWADRSLRTRVISFPEAVKHHLIEIAPTERHEMEELLEHIASQKAPHIQLYNYQRDAIDSWFKNQCNGIFEMATGTGKTFTALGALKQLLVQEQKLVAIIACPFLHLIRQWEDSMQEMGFKITTIEASSANSKWREEVQKKALDISLGNRSQFIILTTHDTLASSKFRELMEEVECPIVLIADEVHGLGAVQLSEGLLERYQFRLGLSATPERYFDEVGSEKLRIYFDGTVYEFSLHRAINEINPRTDETYLCPYRYFPLFVELTADGEMEDYIKLSRGISKLYASKNRSKNEELRLETLLRNRQDILKNAKNKYSVFRDLITGLLKEHKLEYTLVYCSPQQLEPAQTMLHETGSIKKHRFTSRENATKKEARYGGKTEREHILSSFARGAYQVLLAIRCLDEGVDVPATKTAILMCSSGNPREHIQRRGRILRRFPGKEEAVLYDITALPNLNEYKTDRKTQQEMVNKQLERINEFGKDALNKSEVLSQVFVIRQRYGV